MIVNNLVELRALIKQHKIDKFKIGTINGTFDLLHKGHVDAFNYAINNCEKLFILINSDRSVGLYKGQDRPIENEKERSKKIEAFYPEAIIYVFDELNPLSLLDEIMPDLHFIGPDWGKKTLEQTLVEKNGGKVDHVKKQFQISTTQILEKKGITSLSKNAIFLDRDGTIVVDKKYLSSINEIEFFPETFKALEKMSNLGFLLFIVSNQSMVARNMSTEKEAFTINDEIVKQLKAEGIEIKESYLDFSHPNNPSTTRKPNVGFLEKAASEYNLILKNSWVIGDKESDVIFGKRGNTKTIQINGSHKISNFSDYIANNLEEAYEIISKY